MKRVLSSGARLAPLWLMFLAWGALAQSGVAAAGPPSAVGELGPLLPFHKDAIAAGLTIDSFGSPRICFWMRPSEYKGTDLVDPTRGPIGEFKPEFNQLVYGGFGFSALLDESVKSRIKADIALDNALCFDMAHPDAFKNTGKFRVEDLTEEDFALNAAAFTNAGGRGGGLNYNAFCSGNVALADGRWAIIGGHDKTGMPGSARSWAETGPSWYPEIPAREFRSGKSTGPLICSEGRVRSSAMRPLRSRMEANSRSTSPGPIARSVRWF